MARILIIDDEAPLRFTLRMTLELAGHQVREARDGEEGLRLLTQAPSELLFCDLYMPGKDGLETIWQLRRDFPEVKVVAMSGGGFGGTLDMLPVAERFGASRLLKKPFDRITVLATVEEVLRSTAANPDTSASAAPSGTA